MFRSRFVYLGQECAASCAWDNAVYALYSSSVSHKYSDQEESMRIVNPAFGLEEGDDNQSQAVDLSTDWNTDAIAIISNSKPNARELLEGVRAQMGVYRSTDNIDYFFKDSAAKPAPEELYDEVAASYKGAIVALAD
tara:strand:+ start:558 stop:968 length:411 start_codon:yes stop_codon:yes gene_type:complete